VENYNTLNFFDRKKVVKELLYKVLDHKYWFIITIITFLIVAFLYNKYTDLTFQNRATILLETKNNRSMPLSDDMASLFGMGLLDKNIENELGIIKSFSLIRDVIERMNLEVSYYIEQNLLNNNLGEKLPFKITTDLYNKSPVSVILDKSFPQAIDTKINLIFISEDKFKLSVEKEDAVLYNYIDNKGVGIIPNLSYSNTFRFGEVIKTDFFSFKIVKNPNVELNYYQNKNVYFTLNHLDYLTMNYIGSLMVAPIDEASSIIEISLKGSNPAKITDFINRLISTYFEKKLEKKNQIAISTVDFIENQISEISDSLALAQNNLQTYRTHNKIMDLSFQGQRIFEQMSELETEKASLEVQLRYYKYLQNYLKENDNIKDLVSPSSMNVVDPLLNNLITELMRINSERSKLITNQNRRSPYVAQYDKEIKNLKNSILENVGNNLNTLEISINEIDYRISKLSNEITRIPKTELKLRAFERKFKLNDAIYTFLLQKRAEAQIARASNTPDFEIVDSARTIRASIIAPKTKMNYLLAIFMGFFLPFSILLIKDFLNDKIMTKKDLEHLTKLPVLGHIYHNYKKSNLVVSEFPNSAISESFRAIRTNLQILNQGKSKMFMVITSSKSGEGKSFFATNMASSFAAFGRKTLLMGFDLRRPMIYQDFGLTNMLGISSYLSNRALLNDIIQPAPMPNLDFIAAGPVPPNPVELIASDKTREFIEKIKEIYDYIIIDTAPVGVVSDSYFLMNYADVNIFLTRQNFTQKEPFIATMKEITSNKVQNMHLVLNDVTPKKGYGYGYDSKYYTDDHDTSLINKIFGKKSKKRESA